MDLYKIHRPDLVLMDIEEIQELDKNPNIVAITGYPFTEQDVGAEVMRKGFTKNEFLDLVERRLISKS